jgi:hypothetical protein
MNTTRSFQLLALLSLHFIGLVGGGDAISAEPVRQDTSVEKADTPQRSLPWVSAKEVDEFEVRLGADNGYLMELLAKDRNKAEALIRSGQRQRPAARLWSTNVQMLFAGDQFSGKSLQGKERVAHFKYALGYLQESYDIAVETFKKAPDEQLQEVLPSLQLDLALGALEAGETELAKKYAAEALQKNTDAESWDYGNTINNTNQILGRCALREGKLADATAYMFKAGATPGSPQLNSFGHRMQLAEELMGQGEREAVLQYLRFGK